MHPKGRVSKVAAKRAKRERPVQSMLRGLREATGWAEGEKVEVRATEVFPVDVREIRERLRLSQAQFAEKYGFSLDAVQNWEQGRRVPERYARILLTIVDRHPDFVEAILRAAG